MRLSRFRLRTLLLLISIAALLLALFTTVISPRLTEHNAFARLSNRILYAGAVYDGPQWSSRSLSDFWFFTRIRCIHLRIESVDTDRTEMIEQLAQFSHLEKIELVAGDPLPSTQAIMTDAFTELRSKLAGVEVTLLTD